MDFSKPWFAHGKQLLRGTVFDCEVVAEFQSETDCKFVASMFNREKKAVDEFRARHDRTKSKRKKPCPPTS